MAAHSNSRKERGSSLAEIKVRLWFRGMDQVLARRGRGWSLASAFFSGSSMALSALLGLAMLVTIGMAMFLTPVLIPGYLLGFLCGHKALTTEGIGERDARLAKVGKTIGLVGLCFSLALSALAGLIVLLVKLGHD